MPTGLRKETNVSDDQQPPVDGYTPPATQADLDRIIADRLSRERAKFADYDELKAKAAKLADLEDASKSEAQRQAEALAAAQARISEFEARDQVAAWKAQVAKATGVPVDALAGTSLEDIEAHAEVLKPLLVAGRKKGAVAPYVPGEGKQPAGTLGTTGEKFAAFLEDKFTK